MAIHTSSLMIKLGRRPGSSGGINEPRRLPGPELGANELFRLGLFSRITSILGASTAGALISGTLTDGTSYLIRRIKNKTFLANWTVLLVILLFLFLQVCVFACVYVSKVLFPLCFHYSNDESTCGLFCHYLLVCFIRWGKCKMLKNDKCKSMQSNKFLIRN